MYLIFSHGRSGTSELLRAIRSFKVNIEWEPFKNRSQALRPRTCKEVDARIAHMSDGCVKHLWSHLPNDLNDYILKHSAFSGKVVLYRKDVFSATMSLLVARQTKQWRYINDDTRAFRVDPELFEKEMQKLVSQQDRYKNHPAADLKACRV
ncbi:hypothetical protein [Fodinicurvata fenggangensis]|uniref:hypothetical protein n=1 Tax=Fodinicurvata fenggangensis TaxID=1121830 RepID=UPI0012DE09DF|nr:hypothetical protein [Fodinicurvata fenggangensis]